MPYLPKSQPWCCRCARDEDDAATLFPVYLSRSLMGTSARRTTRTIPIRICADCARIAIEASAKSSGQIRPDPLERSRPSVHPARTDHGAYASWEAIVDASRSAAVHR
jgi:hypothetical protein